jgi:hypothetical protein
VFLGGPGRNRLRPQKTFIPPLNYCGPTQASRKDIFNYIPIPELLRVGSLGHMSPSLQNLLVPGDNLYVTVFFTLAKWMFQYDTDKC